MSQVFELPKFSRSGMLQDELYKILLEDRFKDITNAEVIGVLEFLKWNLINRSSS